jgi:hypothetical protein
VTPGERVDAAGRWLAQAGGTAAPGDVGAALGVNHARQAEVVAELRRQGLAEGDKRTVRLTPAGWARFAGVEAGGAGAVLDRVLAGWPYTHRAFLELLISTVIARHHLGAQRRDGHLAFIAIGETGTGKSVMGQLVCHLFGFPPARHTVHVPAQTAGSLLGRRDQDAGGWRWTPAPMTRLPFVVLDEFDKAEEPVQRRAWVYLHDSMDQQLEDRVHELLPTPLLAANPPATGDRYRALRPEYRRRSVVLDTGGMVHRGGDLDDLLRAFYASTAATDRLPLERLVPPATLEPRALDVLRSVRNVLTDAGKSEYPSRGLEMATLGRCALMGPGADHELAAFATSVAYLQATESVPGQVVDGWMQPLGDMRAAFGEAGTSVAAALERGQAERAQVMAIATDAHRRRARIDVGIREAGEVLAERCRQQITALHGNKITPDRRPEAAGLRRTLRTFATTAAQVSTAASLAEVTAAAAEPLERARQLVVEVTGGRLATEQAARDAQRQAQTDRAVAVDERRRAKVAAVERRRQMEGFLAGVVAAAKPLEALYERTTTRPRETPLDVLLDLKVNGVALLTYRPPAAVEPARGVRWLFQSQPTGTWHVTDARAVFAGTSYSCPALAAWGPETRSVLAPALVVLYGREDQLRAELGTVRTRRRPQVTAPAGTIAAAPQPLVSAAAARYRLGR